MSRDKFLPSNNRPRKAMPIPLGALDAWVVSGIMVESGRFARSVRVAVHLNCDEAYNHADDLYVKRAMHGFKFVKVAHKAVIELGGKFYMMNVSPVHVVGERPAEPKAESAENETYEPNMPEGFVPRQGALRFVGSGGDYVAANPHDLTYSTVTMLATECYREGAWWKIHDDPSEEGDNHE